MKIGNSKLSPILTPDGGIAIRAINKTGANSIKGTILDPSPTTNKGVRLIPIDGLDPIAIMYSNNVPDGDEVLIIISGLAYVLYSTAVTRATFSRGPNSGDGSATAGYAINEALPTPPFATDDHFREIGHPIESIVAPGLALTLLHFN